MKQFARTLVPGLLLFWLTAGSAFAEGRIATVDLRRVFDNYWKTKQADALIKERKADMDKELKNMLDDWKKAQSDYRDLMASASDLSLSAEERDRRKKSAEDKLKYIKDQEDTMNQVKRQDEATISEQLKRMRDNILVEIRNVLDAKAKKEAFSLVIDTAAESANLTPIIMYSTKDNDLTDDILKQLNSTAPVDTTKAEEKKDEKKDDKKDVKKDEKK
jgi:outer membrane protein